jgi:cytoskeleton protein RodZ
MDVGAVLREARIARGLSLRAISDRTRIGVSALGAIEADDLDRLPPAIFTRGFLKAYAREVGLDGEAIARRYTVEMQERADALAGERLALGTRGVREDAAASGWQVRENLRSGAIVVALAAAAFLVLGRLPPPDSAAREATGAAEGPLSAGSSPAADGPQPAGTTGSKASAASGGPAATGGSTLRLVLQPTGPCWVEARADGTRVIYRLMNAGDRQEIEAHGEILLKVGDPGSFRFAVNGREGRSLGEAGQPTTVRIAPENIDGLTSAAR